MSASSPPNVPSVPAGPTEVTFASARGLSPILVLTGIFFAILMGSMDSLVVATVLPTIARQLDAADGVTFVVSAYLIASTIAIPVFARWSDIGSRRNVFLIGVAIFLAGSALAGLSENLAELIVFRAVQGFGGGGVFPVALAMVAVMFPPADRSRVTGALSGAAGIAIVLGPLVGSYIVSVTTWRWVFYINLPFGVLALVVLALAVGPLTAPERGRFDTVGGALLSGWVGALMLAVVQVADAGWAWADPRVIGLLLGSAVLFVGFLRRELRTAEPLVPLRLFRQRMIAAGSGVYLFTGVVFNSLITFLSVFVGLTLRGGGPGATSDVRDMLYFLAVPLVIGAVLGGQLLLRVSYRGLVAPSLALSGFVGLLLGGVTPTTPLWVLGAGFVPIGGLALPLMLVGFGLGLSLSGVTIAVQNEAPRAELGGAIGLTRFLQSLGGAVGLSLLTAFGAWRDAVLSAGATGPAAREAAMATTDGEIFLLLAGCTLVALLFSAFFRGRVPLDGTGSGDPDDAPPTAPNGPGAAGGRGAAAARPDGP